MYFPIRSNVNTVDEIESEPTRVFQNSSSELVGKDRKQFGFHPLIELKFISAIQLRTKPSRVEEFNFEFVALVQ